ncbi:phosphate ABC transporter substrate-binding protein [bacterium]|nr:phosphate ABC transporter substrate-binding protein [candidate division CSSED10-310 bacterium]
MNKVFNGMLILFLMLSSVFCVQANEIVIKGSTTVLPIAQAAAEKYMQIHPEVKISVSGGGSGNGIKALIDQSTDIADSSRFLKDSEIRMAMEKNILPVPHRIALDSVVPVVHPENILTDITIDQLKGIYTGQIKNWKEIGGKDMVITVVSRDTSSGTYEIWESKVLNKERVTPKAQTLASNGAVAQAVASNPYAIGYVGIGYINKDLKALTVNGIEATIASAISGVFPVSRPLFMFTSGWPEGETAAFLTYVVSPEGQKVVQAEGYVPLYILK